MHLREWLSDMAASVDTALDVEENVGSPIRFRNMPRAGPRGNRPDERPKLRVPAGISTAESFSTTSSSTTTISTLTSAV